MNGGAYGTEIFDCIEEVEICDLEGNIKKYKKNELEFQYRTTQIKKNKWIVVSVLFKFYRGFDKACVEDKKGQRKNNTADEIKENPLAPAYAQNTGIPLKLPLNLRVDEDVSGYFEKFADEIGLSCNDLMNLFLRQAKTESLLPGFVEKINRRRKTAA